ncbi:hypothetical protein JHK87_052855 [Glycine soja]|nr:hypothetical protein JHK87_052855 [Glycine soja]
MSNLLCFIVCLSVCEHQYVIQTPVLLHPSFVSLDDIKGVCLDSRLLDEVGELYVNVQWTMVVHWSDWITAKGVELDQLSGVKQSKITWLEEIQAPKNLVSNVNALKDVKLEKVSNLREESSFFWREINDVSMSGGDKSFTILPLCQTLTFVHSTKCRKSIFGPGNLQRNEKKRTKKMTLAPGGFLKRLRVEENKNNTRVNNSCKAHHPPHLQKSHASLAPPLSHITSNAASNPRVPVTMLPYASIPKAAAALGRNLTFMETLWFNYSATKSDDFL